MRILTLKRVDQLIPRVDSLQNQMEQSHAIMTDKIEECSNETSMVHNYSTGLHCSIVEHGKFLRNGCGFSQLQRLKERIW